MIFRHVEVSIFAILRVFRSSLDSYLIIFLSLTLKLKKYCCTRGNMTLLSWEREKTENIIIYEVELVLAIN